MPSPTRSQAFVAPSLALLAAEPLRALLDFCSGKVSLAPPRLGQQQPVVVYPGLGGGAFATLPLRGFLRDCGFAAHDWGLGVNTGPDGPFEPWIEGLAGFVRDLHAQHGRPVSLLGWSLGGIYAREVAKRCPPAVRQVITLATPFAALGVGTHAATLYRLLRGDTSELTPQLQQWLRQPPPVPTTSVYSRTDGVVCWRSCLEQPGPTAENVEVSASHLGMVAHPQVLRVVADRLALPDGEWRPYRPRRAPSVRRPLHQPRG